jgi:hypothetical protein
MSTMHLDEEQVQRLLHGEMAGTDVTPVREHVEQCADCRLRLEEARRDEEEVAELLRHLDHPSTRVTAKSIVARSHSNHRRWMNRAAAILLTLSLGGVAWAAPQSPLRALVGSVIDWMGGSPESQTPPATAPATPPPAPGAAGIAVPPGQSLVILFMKVQADGAAHVVLTDGADVVVRAPAGAAAFTSNDDRLLIDNAGSSASFEIEIPRTAARVEIRVGGERIFEKNGPRVTAATAVQSGERYVFALKR